MTSEDKRMKRAEEMSAERLREEALGYFALLPAAALGAIVTGRLDARELAAQTLACGGLDERGKWVGFEASEQRMRALAGPTNHAG